jgi:hypothetical protein
VGWDGLGSDLYFGTDENNSLVVIMMWKRTYTQVREILYHGKQILHTGVRMVTQMCPNGFGYGGVVDYGRKILVPRCSRILLTSKNPRLSCALMWGRSENRLCYRYLARNLNPVCRICTTVYAPPTKRTSLSLYRYPVGSIEEHASTKELMEMKVPKSLGSILRDRLARHATSDSYDKREESILGPSMGCRRE